MRLALGMLVLILLAGCPHTYKRSYPEPKVADVLHHLGEVRAGLTSFNTDSTMDYWVGDDRFKGTVYVMGALGSRVRMNALKPDDSVAADLACNGADFVLVDQLNNCVMVGPCNADSINQLLRVPLAPDDFLYLALGATPVIPGADGKLHWDAKDAHEVLELEGEGGLSQTLVLDGGGKRWDVLKSIWRDADGKVVWSVKNTGFTEISDAEGKVHRVPSKTRFETPSEKSDVLVDWGAQREINVELGDDKFQLDPPDVKWCGEK